MGHVVAVALLQYTHEPFMQARLAVIAAQGLGVGDGFGLVLPVDQVPGRQIKKNPVGHLALVEAQMFVTEQRHDLRQVQLAVVVGAANVHTRGGQNVGAPVSPGHARWPQADHSEVRGAAP